MFLIDFHHSKMATSCPATSSLTTLTAHGCPDHPRGYVHRGQGVLAPDKHMADLYRANLKQHTVHFNSAIQRSIIEAALEACACQQLRCHSIATESTHVHILTSWDSNRTWVVARKQIRRNIANRLNQRSISAQSMNPVVIPAEAGIQTD